MTWFVYLIECTDRSIYTGITVDVDARYAAHASGKGARYTRSHPPSRLLAAFACRDRSTALRAEHRIRQLSAQQKRQLCARHAAASRDAGEPSSKGSSRPPAIDEQIFLAVS